MEKDPSPLDTLRQLKEWLDAGTITPEEFQTLKQKLVFSSPAPPPPVSAPPADPPVPELPPAAAPAIEVTPPPAPVAEEPAPPVSAPPVVPPAPTPPVSALPVAEEPAPPVSAPPVVPPAPTLPVNMAAPVAVVPPAFPTTPAPSATIAPIEDPMLPPLTQQPAPGQPAEAVPPAPPVTGPGFSHPLEAGRPAASPGRADEFLTPAGAPGPAEEYVEDEAYSVPRKSPLGTILVVVGIVALLALVVYLMQDNQASERLTSTTITAADSVATRPEEGPQTEQIDLPPVAAPETIRVAQPAPPVVAPALPDTATSPVVAPAPSVAAVSDAAAETRITGVLQRYYADLQASPFTASAYFAPQVERFYLMQNTTPAAINAELEKTHFPEFLEGQSSIRPGTLQVSPSVADGSRVVTYVENSTALRQSLQKHQQTAAQVRVRFDKDFKIVYLRQEKLLENNFTD